MRTAPDSAPTSPETDYLVVSDLSSSLDALSLSSLSVSESASWDLLSTSAESSRRNSSDNASDDFEHILAQSPSTSGNDSDTEASQYHSSNASSRTTNSIDNSPPVSESSDEPISRPTPTPRPPASRQPQRRGQQSLAPTPVYDSDSESSTGTERPSRSHSSDSHIAPYAQSIGSASEAKLSVDSFFADPSFSVDDANKLRFWQALCVEFGLVDLEDTDSLPDLPSDSSDLSDSLSATPTQRVPLPTSLTQAKKLLESTAHVNIKEYRLARNDKRRQHGRVGAYADLVYPSASAMMRATRKSGAYARLHSVKHEWLNPLLRTFYHR